jgi:hypothetical protein
MPFCMHEQLRLPQHVLKHHLTCFCVVLCCMLCCCHAG